MEDLGVLTTKAKVLFEKELELTAFPFTKLTMVWVRYRFPVCSWGTDPFLTACSQGSALQLAGMQKTACRHSR